jgi:hypothetical protein
MKKSSKRRSKSLSLKIQHLQLELEEREEVLRQYEVEFFQVLSTLEVDDIVAKETPKGPTVVVAGAPESAAEVILDAPPPVEGPEEMKQLWRSIAVLTHPDKTRGDEEKADFYKRANEAWRGGNYGELYKIALALDIEVPESEVTYVTLEEITTDLEKKISEREKSVLWEWGRAQGATKQRILDAYLNSKGKKRKA